MTDQQSGSDQQNWPDKGKGMQYWGTAPPVGTYKPPRAGALEWAGSWFMFTALVIVGLVAAPFWTGSLFVFGALLVVWFGLWIARTVRERREFNAKNP